MHCASPRSTEVTVHTPPWWPTSVSPLSSWVVNTIWSPRAVPSNCCSVVSASTVNVVGLSLSLDEPQAGLIAPTASATSAMAVPATPNRLPMAPPLLRGPPLCGHPQPCWEPGQSGTLLELVDMGLLLVDGPRACFSDLLETGRVP